MKTYLCEIGIDVTNTSPKAAAMQAWRALTTTGRLPVVIVREHDGDSVTVDLEEIPPLETPVPKPSHTLEEIQDNLRKWMLGINPNTKTGRAIEATYIKGLRDAGATVPPVCDILLLSGRSIVEFKPTPQ
jgi:hypothetical protein